MTAANSIHNLLKNIAEQNNKVIQQALKKLLPSRDRRLKIHTSFSPRKNGIKQTPRILLDGAWLKQAGFTQGNYANVTVKNKVLLITPF